MNLGPISFRLNARCSECEKKRERCRPVTKHVDGHIEHVCPQCWKKLDYASFWGSE